jgi:hypothetical protein
MSARFQSAKKQLISENDRLYAQLQLRNEE